ncbi:Hypothetical predicted protein [Drosophila guanche]|uniref:Uncharacterized protein n=1 Tax=Drosophila guanche TaxID=7266 RepID=A0A3B0K1A3_DROGU|nr:Hypothetical predicted protein [Drosophila guanche]
MQTHKTLINFGLIFKVTPLQVSHHYSPLVSEIAKAREHIQTSLEKVKVILFFFVFLKLCLLCLATISLVVGQINNL